MLVMDSDVSQSDLDTRSDASNVKSPARPTRYAL